MGSKYKFEASKNPPPGYYEPNVNMIKPSSKGGKIHQSVTTYKRQEEALPEPGQYQKDTVTFGSGLKKVADMGRKYEFKVDSNPKIGQYDVDTGLNQTKARSKAARILTKTSTYKKAEEHVPDPGQYDAGNKNFGDGVKGRKWEGKYIHKYDPSLGPGYYEKDKALQSTLVRSQSAVIR